MQKWEYMSVELLRLDALEREISPYGEDGWELAAMASTGAERFTLVFKRPRPESGREMNRALDDLFGRDKQ